MLKIAILFLMKIVILFLIMTVQVISAENITIGDAKMIASECAYEDEYVYASDEFVVYHDDSPYYVVYYYIIETGTYNGSVIIDATSGEIIEDGDIVKEIYYTEELYALDFFTRERLLYELELINDIQIAAYAAELLSKNFTELAREENMSDEMRRALENASFSCGSCRDNLLKWAEIQEECYNLEKKWLEKRDTKLTRDIVSKNDEMISHIAVTLLGDIKHIKENITTIYDILISETVDPYEKFELESEKRTLLKNFTEIEMLIDILKDEWEDVKFEVIHGDGIYGVNWELEKMYDRLELLAKYEFTNLSVPQSVRVGEDMTIKIDVTNIGEKSGHAKINLRINGEIVDRKEVALNVGETKTVEFRYVNNEPGTYTVEVNGKTSEYEVRKGWELWKLILAIILTIILTPIVVIRIWNWLRRRYEERHHKEKEREEETESG